jgi:hypothetical protein
MSGSPFSNSDKKDPMESGLTQNQIIVMGIIAVGVLVGVSIWKLPESNQSYIDSLNQMHLKIDNMTCPQLYNYAFYEACGVRTGCFQNPEWQYANYTFFNRCHLVKDP